MEKGNSSYCLSSERLRYQLWEEKDAHFLFDHYTNNEILKYMKECKLNSKEEALQNLRNYNKDFLINGYSMLKTVEKESNNVIGVSGCFQILVDEKGGRVDDQNTTESKNFEVELGYDYNPRFWGKGYATESSNFWINYIFCKGYSNKIVAFTDLDNLVSQRVLFKCSFEKGKETSTYLDIDKVWKFELRKK